LKDTAVIKNDKLFICSGSIIDGLYIINPNVTFQWPHKVAFQWSTGNCCCRQIKSTGGTVSNSP